MNLREQLTSFGIRDPKELVHRLAERGLVRKPEQTWDDIENKIPHVKGKHGKKMMARRGYTKRISSSKTESSENANDGETAGPAIRGPVA